MLDQDRRCRPKCKLAATVTADLERNAHRLAEPEIDVTVSGQGYPADGVPVQVRAKSHRRRYRQGAVSARRPDGQDHLEERRAAGGRRAGRVQREGLQRQSRAQTLELAGLDADAAGAHLTGSLTGAEILDAPTLKGALKLDPSRCASGCRSSASTRLRPRIRTC